MRTTTTLAIGLLTTTLFAPVAWAEDPGDEHVNLANTYYLYRSGSPECHEEQLWSESNGHPGLQAYPRYDANGALVVEQDTYESTLYWVC